RPVALLVAWRRRGGKLLFPVVVFVVWVGPVAFAVLVLDAPDKFGEQFAAERMAAIIVVGRRLDRQIGVAELGIDRDRRPHAGVAGVAVGIALPGIGTELARLRHSVERPFLLAGARIERQHVAGRVAHIVRNEA